MKKFLVLLALVPAIAFSQDNHKKGNRDSLNYYSNQLRQISNKSYDSMRASAPYQEALAGYQRNLKKSNGYVSFAFFGGVTHSDFSKFNKSIAQSGFKPLNENTPSFGLGMSAKNNRFLFDFYVFSACVSRKTEKDDETIKFNLTNMWMFDLGYDVLKSRVVSFYPYAGVSFRFAQISYTKPAQTNPDYTDISNFLINDRSITFNSDRFGYQAGLGLDLLLKENEERNSKTYFFVKAGVNRPIGGEKYKDGSLRFNPQIKSGEWAVHFGFKFAGKN